MWKQIEELTTKLDCNVTFFSQLLQQELLHTLCIIFVHLVIQILLLMVHDGILQCVPPRGCLKFLVINELGGAYGEVKAQSRLMGF